MKQSADERAAERQYQNDREASAEQRAVQIADRDEQRAYDRDAFVRLVADSEKAGFNPMSVLRNGGTSYQNYSPMAPPPLLSKREVGGSAVGDAFMGFGQAVLDKWDPFNDAAKQESYRVIASQVASMNGGALSSTSAKQKNYGSGAISRSGSSKSASLSVNKPGQGVLVGGDNPTVSSLGLNNGKYGVFHAPWMPDAETIEKIYGESEQNSFFYGVAKYASDGAYSAYRNVKQFFDDRGQYYKNIKPSKEARKQYFDYLHDSIPSLIPGQSKYNPYQGRE